MFRKFWVVIAALIALACAVFLQLDSTGDAPPSARSDDEVGSPSRTRDEPRLEGAATTAERAAADRVVAETAGVGAAEQAPASFVDPATCRVRGRVVSKDGAPVPGARVEFESEDDPDAKGEAITQADGSFELRDLAPAVISKVVVLAEEAGSAERDLWLLQIGETRDLGPIVVTRGGRISGFVVDRDGLVVAEAKVTIDETGIAVLCDAHGRFALADVAAGRVTLFANRPGYFDATGESFEFDATAPKDDVRLVLEKVEPRAGRVLDAAGNPVSGAAVAAFARRRADPGAWLGDRETDANGAFTFADVPRDGLSFHCVAAGFVSKQAVARPLGEETVIVLEPGALVRVRGIDGATGAAIELESIEFHITGDAEGATSRYSSTPRMVTQPGGICEAWIEPPRNGRSLVVEGFAEDWPPARSAPFDSSAITTSRAEAEHAIEVVVRFEAGASFAVTVKDAVSRAPIERAAVEVHLPSNRPGRDYALYAAPERREWTDSTGTVTLATLRPGLFRIVARKNGYAPRVILTTAVAGDRTPLEIELGVGGRIDAYVRDTTGANVHGVEVSALGDNGNFQATYSDESGLASFESVPPGRYRVFIDRVEGDPEPAMSTSRGGNEFPHVIAHGTKTVLELTIDRRDRGAIDGTIERDGAPLANARVLASPLDTAAEAPWVDVFDCTTGEAGEFRFERLAPGAWFLTAVVDDEYEYACGEVAVLERGNSRVTFSIVTDTLRGVVRDAETGVPCVGVHVIADQTPSDSRLVLTRYTWPSTTTDDAGAFEFTQLQRGRYAMLLRVPGRPEHVVPDVVVPGPEVELSLPEP